MSGKEVVLSKLKDDINFEADKLTDWKHSPFYKVRSARERVIDGQNQPDPKLIFDEFHVEGEVGILFASVNIGKSIVASQIGEMHSTGRSIGGFVITAKMKRVLFFELELSDKQFSMRVKGFELNDNYYVATTADSYNDLEDLEKFLDRKLEEIFKMAIGGKFQHLIIDNLTWLLQDAEKGKAAANFMKKLHGFNRRTGITVLVVSHTPKRDITCPITMYDLYGSSMLGNFVDHAFCIAESNSEPNLRYIKQVKVRLAEKKYGVDNVMLAKIIAEGGRVYLKNIGADSEYNHLKRVSVEVINDRDKAVKQMDEDGKTKKEIAKEMKISERTVYRILKK